MTTDTIDHSTLLHLVEAHAVHSACVVWQSGGWGVVVKYGTIAKQLAATRSHGVRVFKKLDTLVTYLQGIGIHRFEVDAMNFDPHSVATYTRPDASAALKRAHAAVAHDQWFREQVAQAIVEADHPATQWVSNEALKAESAQRRAAWRKRAATPDDGVV